MAGPFVAAPMANLRVSPLGVVPKKEPNKFRLIHHLSFPKGSSVNDGIDPKLSSVSYLSFDSAMEWVRTCGKGAKLAKTNIEAAFRLLPVHPDSLHLLGCFWDGGFFVDCCLPMGCSISCAYFEAFSTFLEWVVKDVPGIRSCSHYLDDFLFIGPAESADCSILLHTMESVAKNFGVPLVEDKTVGPVTVLNFLGIEIDTVAMECRLPADKLTELRQDVVNPIGLKKINLRSLQSLLGKLNFACRIMPMGRAFCRRRLSLATVGVKSSLHFIRTKKEFRDDLKMWADFLDEYNGRYLWIQPVTDAASLGILVHVVEMSGFGLFFHGSWSAAAWPKEWKEKGSAVGLQITAGNVRNHCRNRSPFCYSGIQSHTPGNLRQEIRKIGGEIQSVRKTPAATPESNPISLDEERLQRGYAFAQQTVSEVSVGLVEKWDTCQGVALHEAANDEDSPTSQRSCPLERMLYLEETVLGQKSPPPRSRVEGEGSAHCRVTIEDGWRPGRNGKISRGEPHPEQGRAMAPETEK
ncbi:unnamed protein product [Ranitomeya imitator]|uniref:Reverse transcriptase domain-containing protein n=1 Tax=Ranitomeya imitator TaxID=111125 RepID=A0ABN9M525_9NEOB|nr:unnamed protein product [Ranitomeya imitator]